MKRRLLSTLLALCMVLPLFSGTAWARTPDQAVHAVSQTAGQKNVPLADALTYEGLSYRIENGQITITDCDVSIPNIVIPKQINGLPVTTIDDHAFGGCHMTSITIPDSITSIGIAAFEGCDSLASLFIPSSVLSIGDIPFYSCFKLAEVNVDPQNPNFASENGILFNKAKSAILFYPSTRTGEYVIPDSVTSIGSHAFWNCSGLSGITIPNGVTSIGDSAFWNCQKLTEISVPDGLTSIGSGAFSSCSGLTDFIIPDSVTSISSNAFWECKGLDHITIPSSVTSIGENAFYRCSGLTDITILNGVTSIGSGAFMGCTNLTGITIPDSVTSIGNDVFWECSGLTSITLPDSVTSLGGAFGACPGLTSITLPSRITFIGSFAFSGCSGLTTIHIPDGVTSIGSYAFSGSGITGITVPDHVTSIEEGAFSSCPSLTEITIPDGITSIDRWAFHGSTSLKSVTLPDGITSIGYGAFRECSSLESLIIPSSVTFIDDWAFWGCSSLTEIAIPDGVPSIGDRTFADCSNLTGVVIPSSVTSIGTDAFLDCDQLANVTIPASVSSIDGTAFGPAVKHIYFQSTKADWRQIEEQTSGISWTEAVIHCTDGTIPAKLAAPENLSCYNIEADTSISVEWELSGLSRDFFQINIYDAANPSAPVKAVTETVLPAAPQASPKAYSCKVSLDDLPSGTYTLTLQSLGRPEDVEEGESFYVDSAVVTSSQWTYTVPEIPVDPDLPNPPSGSLADKLEEILNDVNATVEDIREALESIKNDLINAMKELGPKIFELIKELEDRIKDLNGPASTVVVSGLDIGYQDVTLTGAALNATLNFDTDVRLEIGQPEDSSLQVPGLEDVKTFPFSMNLFAGDTQVTDLEIPIHITMPLPVQNLKPHSLKLWHFHGGNPAPEELPLASVQKDGQLYVSFVLDGFSDFVMTYEESLDEEIPVQPTILYTVSFDTGNAPVTIPAMSTGTDGRLLSLPMPSWNGHRFEGWFLADGSRVTTSTIFSRDTTIYARWMRTASTPETNFVSIPPSEHGQVITADRFAAEGDRVNLSTYPDQGYTLTRITVIAAGGKELTLREKSDGKFSFTMPGRQVKVIAEFEKIQKG